MIRQALYTQHLETFRRSSALFGRDACKVPCQSISLPLASRFRPRESVEPASLVMVFHRVPRAQASCYARVGGVYMQVTNGHRIHNVNAHASAASSVPFPPVDAIASGPFACFSFSSKRANSLIATCSSSSRTCSTPFTSST